MTNISNIAPTMSATMRAGYFAPTASAIDPPSALNDATLVLDIDGTFFVYGATVTLHSDTASPSGPASGASVLDIAATKVSWIDRTKLIAEFDVYGLLGDTVFDVVVQNPDGQTVTMAGAFTLIDVVPVTIQGFTAHMSQSGPELSWQITTDDALRGFRIMRSAIGAAEIPVHGPTILAPDVRSFVDESVESGVRYEYTLVVVMDDGTEFRSQSVSSGPLSYALELHQNYPNPFNPTTTIEFSLPEAADVRLTIYDPQGRRVATLVDGLRPAGVNQAVWGGRNGRRRARGEWRLPVPPQCRQIVADKKDAPAKIV